MRPVPLDCETDSDAACAQAFALRDAGLVEASDRPADEPRPTFQQWVSMVRQVPSHARRWHWVVPDDRAAGPATAYANVVWTVGGRSARLELWVDPGARGRGLGSVLLATALEQAARIGCQTLVATSGTAEGAAFAARHGAVAGNAVVRSFLPLPAVIGVAVPPGYALKSWVDRAPDDLLDSFVDARNAINDSPHTDGADDDAWTANMVREFEELVAARGRQTRVSVAVDPPGTVVAFTELRLSPDPGAVAWLEDTATVAAHRGRGLATAVKAESVRLLMLDRPDASAVATQNDVTNTAILATNRALGFQPVSTWADVVFTVGSGLST